MKGMLIVIVVIALLLFVICVLKMLLAGKKTGRRPDLYEKRDYLLTKAERSFFGVLEQAVQGQLRVMCKVRLADVVAVKKGIQNPERQRLFNSIRSKHVDFVLCDSARVTVQCVVELDDKSHEEDERQERDAFVDQVMQSAGIPIFHFSAKRAYSIEEIRNSVFDKA